MRPMAFFDVEGVERVNSASKSLQNSAEAELAAVLYHELRKQCKLSREVVSVAVLTPYKQQVTHSASRG